MNTKSPLHRAACVAVLSVCAATPALAKDPGFFLGLDLGQSTFDVEDVSATGLFQSSAGARTDDSDTGFALAFGYRLNSYLSFELSMRDLGKATLTEYGRSTDTRTTTFAITGPPASTLTVNQTRPTGALLEIESDSEGFGLNVMGSLPVRNFEFYGKLGVLQAKTTVTTRLTSTTTTTASTVAGCGTGTTATVSGCTWNFPGSGISSESSEDVSILYAIGAGYAFGEEFFLKLEWLRASKLGNEDELGIDEFDVDVISAGFQYRF